MKVTRIGSSTPENLNKAFNRGEKAGRKGASKTSCPYVDPEWKRAWADGHYFGKWQSEQERE